MALRRSNRGFLLGLCLTACWPGAALGAPNWELSLTVSPSVAKDMADRLVRWAESAKTPPEAVERRLVSANWMLGPQLTPAASRLLLGISQPADAAAAREIVAAARSELSAAEEALKGWKDDDQPAVRRVWQLHLRTLRGFAAALGAAWPDPSAEKEAVQALQSEAALELAEALEDNRPEVASAAILWQAWLYHAADREQRALDALPAGLSMPRTKNAFGVYPRLLRCRLVGRSETARVAALALAARVERRCEDWLEAETASRGRAAAALVKREILSAWSADLQSAGESARAAWCDEQIKKIDADYPTSDAQIPVLALPGAAPGVVDMSSLQDRIDGRVVASPPSVDTDGLKRNAEDEHENEPPPEDPSDDGGEMDQSPEPS